MIFSQKLEHLNRLIQRQNEDLFTKLRNGLPAKQLLRQSRWDISSDAELLQLYTWHNGTDPNRWSEGGFHHMSYSGLSFIPRQQYIFRDYEYGKAAVSTIVEIAKRKGIAKPNEWDPVPIFMDIESLGWYFVDRRRSNRVLRFIDTIPDPAIVDVADSLSDFIDWIISRYAQN